MKKTISLKKNYEFNSILKKGKFLKGKYINLYILENKEIYNKIGIAVSKKAANAVKRNRIRRIIRECYRKQEENLKKCCNIVFMWKKDSVIDNITYNDIKNDIESMLKRVNLI